MQAIPLEPVDAVAVTMLIDNVSDMLLQDQGPAKRVGDAGRPLPNRPLGLFEEGQTVDELQAEHGHADHTTGMDGLIRALGQTNLPVLIHPEFWSRRRITLPGRDPVELPTTSRRALEGAGFVIVEDRQPSFLLDGSVLVTGEIDRTTEFERGQVDHQTYDDGAWRPDPLILDDQALVLSVKGKGLWSSPGAGTPASSTRFAMPASSPSTTRSTR